MKVLVLTTQCPYVTGGAEIHARNLVQELKNAGCVADLVTIPFFGEPPGATLDAVLACQKLDVQTTVYGAVDRVIGLKFPAYLMPHPNKVMWVIHQYRRVYELFETEHGFAPLPGSEELRDEIRAEDLRGLREARQIFTVSKNVSARLKKYCSIESRVLYHPPDQVEKFHCEAAEDFFFVPSRLSFMKRQKLVLQALAETRKPVRLVFAGAPDSPLFENQFLAEVNRLGLRDRVSYLGFISDLEKIDLYARCRGVIFTPEDEDYGYVTLEAMLSRKPVLTCTDSGGTLEFVLHRETGWVAQPNPESIASGMDTLWQDQRLASRLGEAGRDFYEAADIQWRSVVDALLR